MTLVCRVAVRGGLFAGRVYDFTEDGAGHGIGKVGQGGRVGGVVVVGVEQVGEGVGVVGVVTVVVPAFSRADHSLIILSLFGSGSALNIRMGVVVVVGCFMVVSPSDRWWVGLPICDGWGSGIGRPPSSGQVYRVGGSLST